MTASHRCNKRKINPRKKSNYFRTLYKSHSFENFLHCKNRENFGFPRIFSLSLMKQKKKDIIIEWTKGDKEIIYLTVSFVYLDKLCNNKNKEELLGNYKLNYNYIYQKLKFKAIGKIRIYSIFLLTRSLYKTEKDSKYISINSKNQSLSTNLTSIISKNNINNTFIDFTFSKKNYCNYYPKINEMREIADKKPTHFPTECFFGVNRFHNEIGKKEYLNLNENFSFNSRNDSYKVIDKKDHVLINHLCHFDTKNKNIISSISIRYRHKNTTFIYYK